MYWLLRNQYLIHTNILFIPIFIINIFIPIFRKLGTMFIPKSWKTKPFLNDECWTSNVLQLGQTVKHFPYANFKCLIKQCLIICPEPHMCLSSVTHYYTCLRGGDEKYTWKQSYVLLKHNKSKNDTTLSAPVFSLL